MIFNSTEQDSAEAITEFKEKPGWVDTFKASVQNFTSVSLSTSASNYYYKERDKTVSNWKKSDPANENVYNAIGSAKKQDLDKLEALYELGKYDAIKTFNGDQTRRQHIQEGDATLGTAFLKFKDVQKQNGFEGPSDIRKRAEQKSFDDYTKSKQVLQDSDYLSAQLVGTAWGALQDPVTLMTLPLGSWKTGATIIGTAGKAFLEEAAIEAGAQALIIPQTHAYKNEIGIKTTIKDDAYNAVMAIGTAGLIRGAGSAAFDLTAKGIKSLKAKNPELGADYEQLNKGNLSTDLDSHIDDLYKTEFSDNGVTEIKNPTAEGETLNKAEQIPIESEDVINAARTVKLNKKNSKTKAEDLKVYSGKDESGEDIYKTYKEISDEIDNDAKWIQKAKDCLL